MARLTALILTHDDAFKRHVGALLRSGTIPVSLLDERAGGGNSPRDFVVVDGRGHDDSALATIERLRADSSGVAIFLVAREANPDLILQAMRAGANEFFAWPLADDSFSDAIRRTAARRDLSPNARPAATTLAFIGAKGGAGTTTLSVNCGVELARRSKRPTAILDLKPGLGEITLFLGVRSRYSLLDAIDNLHRLDSEFLRELITKHKSGLDILAGSDHFDRPGSGDSAAIEEVLRLLTRQYEYILIDAGSQLNACSTVALYAADIVYLVANPDVPSVRNAQRLLDRISQTAACGDRVRILLNRAAEPFPIPPAQIESVLGRPIDHTFPSDYKTVSTALNSGVPLALTGNSDIAMQFDSFTRRIVDPAVDVAAESRRSPLGLQRLASIW
jgi:pilus assembly protein CpaE